jgi:hypothetical protein
LAIRESDRGSQMENLLTDDDDVVWFSIPLDGATIDRLMILADVCHAEPVKIAASLLHDILREDAEANHEPPVTAGNITIN